MMKTMRSIAPWIMLIVAVSFVGWMVFEVGMDVQGQSGGVPQSVVTVNGRGIDPQVFDARVRMEQDLQRQQGLPSSTTLEEWRDLQDAVMEQMIVELLLEEEYRRRGITATDREVRDAMLNVPPPDLQGAPEFQTEGQFDIAKYRRYIQSLAGELTIPLENQYREQIRQAKLQAQISEDVQVSNAKLWRIYQDQNDSVTVDVLALVPSVVAREQTIEVSDEAIETYYRENQEEFERPPQAFVSFVAISRRANGEDSVAAFQRAQDLRQEIMQGADFADVARRESADSVSRAEGGDLGERGLGQFVAPYEEAALALRPGEISHPVLSQFGYHIIRLESRADTSYLSSHILVPIEAYGDHLDEIDRQADSLDLFAAELDDPTVLDTVAADLGLPVAQAPGLYQGNRMQLGRFLVPDIHIWAFEATEGQTSQVIETEWAYYVFRVDSVLTEQVPPLDEIRTNVRRMALQQIQWEQTRALAEEVQAAVAGGADLQQAAAQFELNVQQAGPFTRLTPATAIRESPDAIGAAFGLDVTKVGGPYESQFGLFFVEPIRKVFADSTEFETGRGLMLAQLIQQATQQRVQLVVNSLREQADVVDNRQALEAARRQAANQQIPGGSPLGF